MSYAQGESAELDVQDAIAEAEPVHDPLEDLADRAAEDVGAAFEPMTWWRPYLI